MANTTGGGLQPYDRDTSPFDKIKRTDERGDYWLARELMLLLGYRKWERFLDAIERAMISCRVAGQDVEAAFSRTREAVTTSGNAPNTERINFRLSRHACNLVAQNGDVRKPPIAAAQTYFSVKTFEAENAQKVQLDELEVAERYVATLKRNRELQVANTALEERADVAEQKFAEFEGGPGITLTKFHKKYFSEVPARAFFEHLYTKGYLIDQRGQGPWDEKNQCYKEGPQHYEPSFRGKAFLYLHEAGIFRKKRRFKTLVRPGDPELNFKHRLVADGLRGNAHTTDYLFAIEGGR